MVAEVDDIILGFFSCWLSDNFIHNLFVHPDWQGQGIGTQLLQQAEKLLSRPMRLKIALDNTHYVLIPFIAHARMLKAQLLTTLSKRYFYMVIFMGQIYCHLVTENGM